MCNDNWTYMPMNISLRDASYEQKHPMTFTMMLHLGAMINQYGLYENNAQYLPPILVKNKPIPRWCDSNCARDANTARHIPMAFFRHCTRRRYLCKACSNLDGGPYSTLLNSPYSNVCEYGLEAPTAIARSPDAC